MERHRFSILTKGGYASNVNISRINHQRKHFIDYMYIFLLTNQLNDCKKFKISKFDKLYLILNFAFFILLSLKNIHFDQIITQV